MKTHVKINGKEVGLLDGMNDLFDEPINWLPNKINELLLALDESEPESKPFSVENPPKEGEIFWTVDNSFGELQVRRGHFETEMQEDNNRILDNNCFRTKEEAQAALKRVLEALKG